MHGLDRGLVLLTCPPGKLMHNAVRHRALLSASGVFPATISSRLISVTGQSLEAVRTLLEAPSPAVLTTYRKDGSANVSPVWFRWLDDALEVVIAAGDVKLKHLARDPRCVLLVFETVPPFRGIEVRGTPELVEGDMTSIRADISGRYLGAADGERFAASRTKPGVLLRLWLTEPRIWDLS